MKLATNHASNGVDSVAITGYVREYFISRSLRRGNLTASTDTKVLLALWPL